jgi:hypothetical protein
VAAKVKNAMNKTFWLYSLLCVHKAIVLKASYSPTTMDDMMYIGDIVSVLS